MNVKEHLIYYQRCLQNTTQIALRLEWQIEQIMSEYFRALKAVMEQ